MLISINKYGDLVNLEDIVCIEHVVFDGSDYYNKKHISGYNVFLKGVVEPLEMDLLEYKQFIKGLEGHGVNGRYFPGVN
jgi:hypothetical protein